MLLVAAASRLWVQLLTRTSSGGGLREDLACRGREEVVEGFIHQRYEGYEIDSLELIEAPDHVVLGCLFPSPLEVGGAEVQASSTMSSHCPPVGWSVSMITATVMMPSLWRGSPQTPRTRRISESRRLPW